MDTELVSFRIDATLRNDATKVCASLGLELSDYLRACVTRLVQDKRLPFSLATPTQRPQSHHPSPRSRLWASIDAGTDIEAALLCARAVLARKTAELSAASATSQPDEKLVKRLSRERSQAAKAIEELQADDSERASALLGGLIQAMPGIKA